MGNWGGGGGGDWRANGPSSIRLIRHYKRPGAGYRSRALRIRCLNSLSSELYGIIILVTYRCCKEPGFCYRAYQEYLPTKRHPSLLGAEPTAERTKEGGNHECDQTEPGAGASGQVRLDISADAYSRTPR